MLASFDLVLKRYSH